MIQKIVKKSTMNRIKNKMKTIHRIRRKIENKYILSNKNENENKNENKNKNLPSTPERAKRVIA